MMKHKDKIQFDAVIKELNISYMGPYNSEQIIDIISFVPDFKIGIADLARDMFEKGKMYKVTIEEA